MRKALLLYNPLSGRQREWRVAYVDVALRVLRASGITVTSEPTRDAAQSGEQARDAIASGCDTILACGGDGTVHDILQGMVGSQAALGIIPLGTANALAHDLRIPRNPAKAAHVALQSQPRRFAVGRLECLDLAGGPVSRYFTVAVGVGVDALLFYKLNLAMKTRLGMVSYYLKATHLWLTHKMDFFDVEVSEPRTGFAKRARVSELLAVRIGEFGGILRQLAPGAALSNDALRLVLFKTGNRFRYLQYVLRGLLGKEWNVPGIELQDATQVTCSNGARRIFIEADGELVGTLPATISVVPDAITLLVP